MINLGRRLTAGNGKATQLLTVMSLVTDFVPRTSRASFVTRDFSASELASPGHVDHARRW